MRLPDDFAPFCPRCQWCDEPILAGEGPPGGIGSPLHTECATRALVGSVGHQKRRCSCFRPSPPYEDDPPDMTKREAAKAAFDYFRRQQARIELLELISSESHKSLKISRG